MIIVVRAIAVPIASPCSWKQITRVLEYRSQYLNQHVIPPMRINGTKCLLGSRSNQHACRSPNYQLRSSELSDPIALRSRAARVGPEIEERARRRALVQVNEWTSGEGLTRKTEQAESREGILVYPQHGSSSLYIALLTSCSSLSINLFAHTWHRCVASKRRTRYGTTRRYRCKILVAFAFSESCILLREDAASWGTSWNRESCIVLT
jgi:hypothetical protein